jgi:DNA-binding phage protein
MPKSLPYHPFKIQFLKEPIHSALYLEALFEEKDPEAELLQLALSSVAEALAEQKMNQEKAKFHLEKLDEILSQKGSDAIYNLAGWLKELGLKLTVTVDEVPEENATKTESFEEASVS